MALNMVLAGDFKGYNITGGWNCLKITAPFRRTVKINKSTVEGYEVMDETSKTSTASALIRGGLGVAILGPIGGLAALGARQKGTHVVAVAFKDGRRSMLQLNDLLYKTLMTALF